MDNEDSLTNNQSNIRFLLITANTGTIFEKPELLTLWVTEFANVIRRHPSDFIALHCQEVGGKDYERFMYMLDPFTKKILEIPEIAKEFRYYRLYFDSDYTSQETFTALGSLYFIRQNISIQQWNFATINFQNVGNRQIYSGNLESVQTINKQKFPREFFPETKWSRKGFIHTRWSFNNFVFHMINVHLFHDASNILAAEQSPSVYSKFRNSALHYTLNSLSLNPSIPYAIFGDFNFRLDAHRLLKNITEQRECSVDTIKQTDSEEITKIVIKNLQNKTKLTVGKKEFNLHDEHDSFFSNNYKEFEIYDFEANSFTNQLFEYEKSFPPSYPYSEENDEAHSFLRARCPAWCDRIFLSHSLKSFVNTQISQPKYNIIGEDACMGDHKPVYLGLTVQIDQGCSALASSLMSITPSSASTVDSENQSATSNIYLGETPINTPNTHTHNQTNLPVTVMRKDDLNILSDLILNEIPSLSNDINDINIHDYAHFAQPALLPTTWFDNLRKYSNKTFNNSSKLWTKLRAVTYMTTLAHRTGSWYSDDQTEKSPNDDASSSDVDDDGDDDGNKLKDQHIKFGFDVSQDQIPIDLVAPLRRSFSSIDNTKESPLYHSVVYRSQSTTNINSSDHLVNSLASDSSAAETSSSLMPETPAPSLSPPSNQLSSFVYRFLHCNIL